MNFRDKMTTMKSLLLTLGLAFALAAWAQEEAAEEEPTETQEVAEDAAEEAETRRLVKERALRELRAQLQQPAQAAALTA